MYIIFVYCTYLTLFFALGMIASKVRYLRNPVTASGVPQNPERKAGQGHDLENERVEKPSGDLLGRGFRADVFPGDFHFPVYFPSAPPFTHCIADGERTESYVKSRLNLIHKPRSNLYTRYIGYITYIYISLSEN